jgi:SAM-dependent methyltransferase
MANNNIYNKLACPVCHAPMRRDNNMILICTKCQQTFSYEKDIPVLLDEESQSELNQQVQIAENRRLHEQIATWPWIYKMLTRLRPPHPFLSINARQRRTQFSQLVEEINDSPSVLDIGSGNTGKTNIIGLTRQVQNGLIAMDMCYASSVDIIGDAHKIPFCDETIDGVLIQGVLEHVRNPKRIVDEINRILRPKGVVYVDVPFLQHYHQDPEDYRRYTITGLKQLFGNFNEVATGASVGSSSVLCEVLSEYPAIWFRNPILYWGVKWLFGWLVSPLRYIDYFLINRPRVHSLAGAIYYMGRKI